MRSPGRLRHAILILCFIGLAIVGFLLFLALFAIPPSQIPTFGTQIVITNSGSTNIEQGRTLRLFNLYNGSSLPVVRDSHYTVYWTNSSGAEEHRFGMYASSYVIAPGKSEIVGVDTPESTGKWFATFAFRIEPGKAFRFMQRTPILNHFISKGWSQKYKALDVLMGPTIAGGAATNSELNPTHP
jgi:hypothetical protein